MDWIDAFVLSLYAIPFVVAFISIMDCYYTRKHRKEQK